MRRSRMEPKLTKPTPLAPLVVTFFFGHPPVNDAPVVERHIINAVRHDGSTIRDAVDVCAVDDENAARELIRRPWRNPPIHVDLFGFESPHIETPAIVACAAHEDAASHDGRAEAPNRDIVEVSRDNDVPVSLRVPNRKSAL